MEEFAALIAIDWADRQHAICLYDESTGAREHTVVKHTPAALSDWALALRSRFGGQPIAVCLEQARGPLIYALLQYDFLVLPSIQPRWRNIAKPSHRPWAKTIPPMLTTFWICCSIIANDCSRGGRMMKRPARCAF
jgi:hypothetical protein